MEYGNNVIYKYIDIFYYANFDKIVLSNYYHKQIMTVVSIDKKINVPKYYFFSNNIFILEIFYTF